MKRSKGFRFTASKEMALFCCCGGKNGLFSDLFWTPLIAQALLLERKKDSEMVRALFMAIELHSGKCVTLSQLGSDFKVSQLKKDNMWKSVRLLDILEVRSI